VPIPLRRENERSASWRRANVCGKRGRGGKDNGYSKVDTSREEVIFSHMTPERLEKLGREHGVLKAWEEVER
jgi:hypothetical protein